MQPYLTPLIILLALLAFSTWVINPISNLFLRFNAYGKFLLDKKEKMSSNFVAISFAICLIGILLYFLLADERYLAVAVFGFAMMVPLSVMLSPAKYKYALVIYAVAMAVTGIFAIEQTFATGNIFNSVSPVFILEFIAFQWVVNYLLIKEDNH